MNYFKLTEADSEEFHNLAANLDYALRLMLYEKKLALFLHFWKGKTVSEIAKILNLSWEQADKFIDESLAELRYQLYIAEDLKPSSEY